MSNTTINFRGIDFEVEFDYQPFEKQTHWCEGTGAHIEQVTEFTHKGTDFLELIYEGNEDEIEELILENRGI